MHNAACTILIHTQEGAPLPLLPAGAGRDGAPGGAEKLTEGRPAPGAHAGLSLYLDYEAPELILSLDI